jgi:fluoride ion exporter CrcB/FEX
MSSAVSALFFVIMCAAITYVLCESVIGGIYRALVRRLAAREPLVLGRYALTLAYCPACTGFWVGITLYWLEWAHWALGVPRPEMLAGCTGMMVGLLLPHVTTFSAFSVEVSEQENGTTQSREESESERTED